jgi:hypothetical protein
VQKTKDETDLGGIASPTFSSSSKQKKRAFFSLKQRCHFAPLFKAQIQYDRYCLISVCAGITSFIMQQK